MHSAERSLEDIAKSMKALLKVVETMNSNLVLIGRDLIPPKSDAKNYVADDEGRMLPHEWRHNFGWRDKLPRDIYLGNIEHESERMTEEAFRIYNAGLFTTKIVEEKHNNVNHCVAAGCDGKCSW
jgi:hypothetical protein